MSSSHFVLPITTCSFWPEVALAGTEEGDVADPRFAPDSVVHFATALSKTGPSISEEQVLRGMPLRGVYSFVVSPRGKVLDAFTLSANNVEFSEACLEAIRQWRFEPMRLNEAGVYCRLQVPIAWNP